MAGIKCCYGCQERWVNDTTNCHGTCPKYLAAAKKNEEEKERIRQEKDISNACHEIISAMCKYKKR